MKARGNSLFLKFDAKKKSYMFYFRGASISFPNSCFYPVVANGTYMYQGNFKGVGNIFQKSEEDAEVSIDSEGEERLTCRNFANRGLDWTRQNTSFEP